MKRPFPSNEKIERNLNLWRSWGAKMALLRSIHTEIQPRKLAMQHALD